MQNVCLYVYIRIKIPFMTCVSKETAFNDIKHTEIYCIENVPYLLKYREENIFIKL